LIRDDEDMKRVVILGPGGAGKSTLSRHLAEHVGLPVVELDKHFWTPDLRPLPKDQWRRRVEELTRRPEWIMDGDLGPYDVVEPRLRAADTVVLLDFPRWRCIWRSLRRSPERLDYWRWLLTWRRRCRPGLLSVIAREAHAAEVVVLASPAAVENWLKGLPATP
jgi:adenylate kinase family enzyme